MGGMRAVGIGHRLPAHAKVRDGRREYVIELDVSDFLESELDVDVVGRACHRARGPGAGAGRRGGRRSGCRSGSRSRFGFPTTPTPTGSRSFYAHGTLEIRAPRTKLEPRAVPIEHRSPFVGNPDAEPC